MNVRRANVEDLSKLVGLIENFFVKHEMPFEYATAWAEAESYILDSSRLALVVENEPGNICGILLALTQRWPFSTNCIVAFEVVTWVELAYRNAGAGSALLNSYIKWAKSLGISKIQVGHLHSMDTKDFYVKRGFKPFDFEYRLEL